MAIPSEGDGQRNVKTLLALAALGNAERPPHALTGHLWRNRLADRRFPEGQVSGVCLSPPATRRFRAVNDQAPHGQAPSAPRTRSATVTRALKRHLSRLERKLEAVRGDLAEAERAPMHRRSAEALLAYLKQVPARASRVELPDPSDHTKKLEIELDPAESPQANAARYFKRAAKGERGLAEIPGRVRAVEKEMADVSALLGRISKLSAAAGTEGAAANPELDRLLDEAYRALPPVLQRQVEPADPSATPSSAAISSG